MEKRTEKLICEICAKEFFVEKRRLKENARFCSRSCSASRSKPNRDQSENKNPNWKNGISKNHYHYKKLQVQKYPEKIKARAKVHYAIKVGILVKQPCKICGNIKSFAHHKDYSKPLEVDWLCRKHHREEHNNRY